MEKHARYRSRPVWISGESYAGHYVPLLAQAVLEGNARGNPKINLQVMCLLVPIGLSAIEWVNVCVDMRVRVRALASMQVKPEAVGSHAVCARKTGRQCAKSLFSISVVLRFVFYRA